MALFSLWGRAITCCCWARWVGEIHGWQTRLEALPRLEMHGFTSADPLTHRYTTRRPSVVARQHHEQFTFTQIQCAHFRVLHLLYTRPLLQMYTATLQRDRTEPNPRGVFHYSADEDNYALQAERAMMGRARFQPGTPVPGLDYICQRANSS
jgi:hypothetical protein